MARCRKFSPCSVSAAGFDSLSGAFLCKVDFAAIIPVWSGCRRWRVEAALSTFRFLRYNTDMAERTRVRSTHVLVLRRRDVADADRLLTVLTPGEGKVELLAKGVRKTVSRKSGHLEPFTHAHVMVAQARTWDLITEATTVESFRYLREDLDAIGQASYACELVDAFSDSGDENRPLWELALFVLRQLDEAAGVDRASGAGDAVPAAGYELTANLLRWFDLHLLSLAGFQPQFFNCLGCDTPIEPAANFFSLNEGGVYCARCGPLRSDAEAIPVDVLKVLRYLQSKPWQEVQRLHVRTPLARQVDTLLQRYLSHVLERRLRSTDFLQRLEHVRQQRGA
jgi:DNA repair protein RecO (recombination protein O)